MGTFVARLQGGLGNQMFQYASVYSFAKKHGAQMAYDIGYYRSLNRTHEFGLKEFNISGVEVSATIRRKLLGKFIPLPTYSRAYERLTDKLFKIKMHLGLKELKISRIREPHFHFWSEIDSLPLASESVFEGNWQSEKYFKDVKEDIRKEFQFKSNPHSDFNVKLLQSMRESNSVSVHVRRGDYLSPNILKVHGVCSENYYHEAMRIIRQQISNPRFFIFSNDLEWAKNKFSGNSDVFFVEGNLSQNRSVKIDILDLQLMSSCKHAIIANSTFSWWGAWLGPSDTGMVVAPRKWFATDMYDSKDLFPKEWIVT